MRRDLKTVVWLLALSIVVTFTAGGATVLSGHLEPVPDRPAPPEAAPPGIPEVPATPTPPPQPQDARNTAAPVNTAAPTTPSPAKEPLLLANGRQQPLRVKVPRSARGRYAVAPGEARPPRGKGKVIRYVVEVERGLPFPVEEFAAEVHRILNDRRGWGYRFKRVARGPVRIRVSLSSPATTDRRCLPMRTNGILSCWNGGRAVINAVRWNSGATGYGRDVASYREYVISHEVGHGLGHGHVPCPGHGRRAPVMLQQTKSLYGCRPNPWPSPRR
ncbi:DUF3152 domain-containing protein [Streptosporangium sp. NPDC048865]|uniref:DUF3152 domain-containing protein n=1 Tax=Streptosporangium sp. NPDC048865 TaxID=3155766 RepID=UPI00342C84E1